MLGFIYLRMSSSLFCKGLKLTLFRKTLVLVMDIPTILFTFDRRIGIDRHKCALIRVRSMRLDLFNGRNEAEMRIPYTDNL